MLGVHYRRALYTGTGGWTPTAEERASWEVVFGGGGAPAQLLINYQSYEISREKLRCMASGSWLNDEAINLYMLLLQVGRCTGCVAAWLDALSLPLLQRADMGAGMPVNLNIQSVHARTICSMPVIDANLDTVSISIRNVSSEQAHSTEIRAILRRLFFRPDTYLFCTILYCTVLCCTVCCLVCGHDETQNLHFWMPQF